MRLSTRWAAVMSVLAAVTVMGAGPAGADEGDPVVDVVTFSGSVVQAEPSPLPGDAALTVTLEDVSRADAPAVQLAQSTTRLDGRQAPIRFTLQYPAAAVDPRGIYTARARVTQGDQLLLTTTQVTRVDAANPTPVELVLTRVQPPASPATPDASLTETYWKLIEVAGRPVAVGEQMREPSLVLHGADSRFAGSGGVNRLMGGYTLDGNSLTFSQVASTMMAGPPEAMTQEQAIVGALGQVRGYRISGDELTLTDATGTPVVKAVAVALR